MNSFIKFGLIAAGCAAALSGGAALAVSKAANDAAAKVAVDRRVDALEELGFLMDSKLGPMARRPAAFNAAEAKAAATRMAAISAQLPALFSVDTRGFRLKTSSRDNIWQTHPDFLTKSRALNTAIANLQRAADTGQRPAVVQAVMQVGQTCKACHDSYKAD